MQENNFNYEEYTKTIQQNNEYYFRYKKRQKKPIKISIAFLSLCLIFLLGICVFINQNNKEFCTYYFVEIDTFATFSQANKSAIELTNKSGAGYVFFDKNYHVFAGVYLTEESAKTVSKNILNDYPNAKIFAISTAKFKNKNQYSKNENLALKNTISSIQNLVKSLYQISISFDKNEENFKTTKTKISTLKDTFCLQQSKFDECFENEKIYFNTNKKLDEIFNALTRLSNCSEQDLKQKIKYELVNIAITSSMIFNELC